ncbi:hypothetical protein EVAR_58536_1 [Eumeta japonica]|uniref:Uncharacterized protein n=1 Tax=Eumeta variegata TaxID=151549 RepID=A0A4C1Z4D2_EUMVA|nr:hypothetical protein EVAR_58536_1 [Eumeta japonica]
MRAQSWAQGNRNWITGNMISNGGGERDDGEGKVEWPTGTFAHWLKGDSEGTSRPYSVRVRYFVEPAQPTDYDMALPR